MSLNICDLAISAANVAKSAKAGSFANAGKILFVFGSINRFWQNAMRTF